MSNLPSFVVRMPKVERHAHLNGSIGPNLSRRLVELLKEVDPQRTPPDLPPDWSGSLNRVGHGTCIHRSTGGNEDLWLKLVEKAKSPVEVCLTSNLKCGSVPPRITWPG